MGQSKIFSNAQWPCCAVIVGATRRKGAWVSGLSMRCRWWPNEHGAVDGNAQGVLPHARRKEVLWAVFILILVRTGWAAT